MVSCGNKNAVISIFDSTGSVIDTVTVKYSNATINKYSTIQLQWPSTHSISVTKILVGNTKLSADKYTAQNGLITIYPEGMTSTDVQIFTKITELPTSLTVTGTSDFKTGEFFGADDIVVRTKNSKSEISNPLKWGKDYSISFNGSTIENFDTIGFYFDTQMKEGTYTFTIKYLGESEKVITTNWTINLTKDPEVKVTAMNVALKPNKIYTDETLTDSDFEVKIIYSNHTEKEAWYGYDYYTEPSFPINATQLAAIGHINFVSMEDTTMSIPFECQPEARNLLSLEADETPVNVFVGEEIKENYFDIKCRYDVGNNRVAKVGVDYIIQDNNDKKYTTWSDVVLKQPGEYTFKILSVQNPTLSTRVKVTINPSYSFNYDLMAGYQASISTFTTYDADHMMRLVIPCTYLDTSCTKFEIDTGISGQFLDMNETIKNSLTVNKNSIWTAPIQVSNIEFDNSNQKLTFETSLTGFNPEDNLVITFNVPAMKNFSQSTWTFSEVNEE